MLGTENHVRSKKAGERLIQKALYIKEGGSEDSPSFISV